MDNDEIREALLAVRVALAAVRLRPDSRAGSAATLVALDAALDAVIVKLDRLYRPGSSDAMSQP